MKQPEKRLARVLATAASRPIPFAALSPLLTVDSAGFHPALVPGLVLKTLTALPGTQLPILLVDDAHSSTTTPLRRC